MQPIDTSIRGLLLALIATLLGCGGDLPKRDPVDLGYQVHHDGTKYSPGCDAGEQSMRCADDSTFILCGWTTEIEKCDPCVQYDSGSISCASIKTDMGAD